MPRRNLVRLRVAPLLALVAVVGGLRACGGGRFSTVAGGAGAGAADSRCESPADCDDGDPCTVDSCGVDGACATSPRCGNDLQCCSGLCGECCGNAECDDGVPCTEDACVAGFCSSAPGACGEDEYCSIPRGGCVRLESCGTGQTCDDGDPCTEDSCDGAFCTHAFCPSGGKCCEGRPDLGCSSCCSNPECDDDDLCTDDVCTVDGCRHTPRECPDGAACCPGTGHCGTCCAAADCDDSIDCTDDACVGGVCQNVPDHERCDPGQICAGAPADGCRDATECATADDCPDAGPCETFECVAGQCRSTPRVCAAAGTHCCPDSPAEEDPCRACCSDAECDGPACAQLACVEGRCLPDPDDRLCRDATGVGIADRCDPERGCIECLTAADCGEHPCFAFECRSNECTALAPRECPDTGALCQECCVDADCPSPEGVSRSCCLGRCCAGACDATNGECGGQARDP